MLCRIVAWLLAFLPLATCQFTNPTSGTIFAVGEKVNITYETEWKNYTIALWQRNSNGSGSTLGPIVFGKYSIFSLFASKKAVLIGNGSLFLLRIVHTLD